MQPVYLAGKGHAANPFSDNITHMSCMYTVDSGTYTVT